MRKELNALTMTIITIILVLLLGGLVYQYKSLADKDQPQQNASSAGTITIAAASSLQDTLEAIKTLYQQEQPGVTLTFNFASSGALQQQIEQGAPVDVFISAAKKQMDALEAKGLLLQQTRRNLLQNQVVLIAPINSNAVTGFNSLTESEVTPVALGDPQGVPAGKYAQEVLQSLKLWEQVAPKAVYAKNVRQVLSYVETENAAAGIVYLTDTKKSKQVKVIAIAPEKTHSPVLYPLAILKTSQQPQVAQEFVNFLRSPKAVKVFQDAGFTTLDK